MKFITQLLFVVILCTTLTACYDDENLTPQQRCDGLKRQLGMLQNSNQYAQGVLELKRQNLEAQYDALKCQKMGKKAKS
tara:strand:+ start:43395 stop:43631 length:237 start_codon:yes stop_codon:yes gene_type:complete